MPTEALIGGGISAILQRLDDLTGFLQIGDFHDDANMLLGWVSAAGGVIDVNLRIGEGMTEEGKFAWRIFEDEDEHVGLNDVEAFLHQDRFAGGGIIGDQSD